MKRFILWFVMLIMMSSSVAASALEFSEKGYSMKAAVSFEQALKMARAYCVKKGWVEETRIDLIRCEYSSCASDSWPRWFFTFYDYDMQKNMRMTYGVTISMKLPAEVISGILIDNEYLLSDWEKEEELAELTKKYVPERETSDEWTYEERAAFFQQYGGLIDHSGIMHRGIGITETVWFPQLPDKDDLGYQEALQKALTRAKEEDPVFKGYVPYLKIGSGFYRKEDGSSLWVFDCFLPVTICSDLIYEKVKQIVINGDYISVI